jgi:hypothetical protein
MNEKKFTIVFEFDDRTHWLLDIGVEAKALQLMAENLARCHTTGALPRVTVELPITTPAAGLK